MATRIACPQGLTQTISSLCLRPAARPSTGRSVQSQLAQPLVQKATVMTRTFMTPKEKRKRAKQDPYWWRQYQDRIQSNKKRQEELAVERDPGHAIYGRSTPIPFVESLDSAGRATMSTPPTDQEGRFLSEPVPLPTSPEILNFQLSQAELDHALEVSRELTRPIEPAFEDGSELYKQEVEEHEEKHERAVLALRRITSLEQASSKDRRHANIRRIIDEFGRHKTDEFLTQKPPARGTTPEPQPARGGPDTGSSEVQIAILTAKIRVLSKMILIDAKGNKDKHNKRNLAKLLHRRQRLLQYMERRERGSGRWTHMLETLGLTPATWKGQISL